MPKRISVRGRGFIHEWSPAEDKLLKELFVEKGLHIIVVANNLSCTPKLIYERLKKLKLKRYRNKASVCGGFRYNTKLNADKAREIRELCKTNLPKKEIARRFSVCRETINLVVRNKIWKEKENA